MKKKILHLVILCFITSNVFSQKTEKIIDFIFDTLNYNYPAYETKTIEIEDKILKAVIIDTATKLEIAEFLRIDDNNYYYIRKKSSTIMEEGKAVLEKTSFENIKIPVLDRNGNIKGFNAFNHYKFTREGFWLIKQTDKIYTSENFLNNKKNGRWLYSSTLSKRLSIGNKEIFYKNDVVTKENNLQILSKSKKEIEAELIGYWEIEFIYNPMDTLQAFFKKEVKTGSKISLTFNEKGECKMNGRSHHRLSSQIYKWEIEDNIIKIKADEKTVFVIENMNKGYLVLSIMY